MAKSVLCLMLLGFAVVNGAEPNQGSGVTYSKDIAPILYEHCATCHHLTARSKIQAAEISTSFLPSICRDIWPRSGQRVLRSVYRRAPTCNFRCTIATDCSRKWLTAPA